MAVDELVSAPTPPVAGEASRLWEGKILDDAAGPAALIRVALPGADNERHATGPCTFMPKGTALPKAGDPCLLALDDDGTPWIVAWQPANPAARVLREGPLNVEWPEFAGGADPAKTGTQNRAALQALYDQAATAKGAQVRYPRLGYHVDGKIDLDNSYAITSHGPGGPSGIGRAQDEHCIVFDGTGSDPVFSCRSSMHAKFYELPVVVTSNSMAGWIFDYSGNQGYDSGYGTVRECEVGGVSDSVISALGGVCLERCVSMKILENEFKRMQCGVVGKTSATYSNAITLFSNTYQRLVVSAIKNAHEDWDIISETFQQLLSGKAGAYLDDVGIPFGPVNFWGGWLGDAYTAGNPWIRYKGSHLKVDGLRTTAPSAGSDPLIIIGDTSPSPVLGINIRDTLLQTSSPCVQIDPSAGLVYDLNLTGNDIVGVGALVQDTGNKRQSGHQLGNGGADDEIWQGGARIFRANSTGQAWFGAAPVGVRTLAAAATDAATTQTLANSLRQALLDLGLSV